MSDADKQADPLEAFGLDLAREVRRLQTEGGGRVVLHFGAEDYEVVVRNTFDPACEVAITVTEVTPSTPSPT